MKSLLITIISFIRNALQNAPNDITFEYPVKILAFPTNALLPLDVQITAPIKSKTKWSDLFDDFAEYKRGFKKITETTINQNRGYLETVFYLMKNPVLEDITYKHCLTVCKLISKVPLRWKDRYNNASLLKLVNEVDEKGYETLSTASIRNHLMTFKEFLRFAKKRRYITEAFEYDIDIPKKEKGKERESFSGSELVKIFNVRTYNI